MIDASEQEKLRARFNPDGSLLRRHQLRMLEMLKYIDDVCKRHDIKYWLCSGTLLGAVRHGGFIPWDDDVDIEMLREDYIKFAKIINKENSINYVLQTHTTDKGYVSPFAKLRDLHSSIKENGSKDINYKYKGCFIDVFIMDPSSSLFLYKLSNWLQLNIIALPNQNLQNETIRKIYLNITYPFLYKIIFPILRLFSKIGARGQLRHTLGSGFIKPRYLNDILPLTRMNFEGLDLPVPKNSDAYLRKIYGNYMCLPKLETIVLHTTKIELF